MYGEYLYNPLLLNSTGLSLKQLLTIVIILC